MFRDAELSEDGKFRYWLSRLWDRDLPTCNFIMLNPSTADHRVDDPTVRACIEFAKRAGCGMLTVTNLFDFRATKPSDLFMAATPCSPGSLRVVSEFSEYAVRKRGVAVCAWGAHGGWQNRNREVYKALQKRNVDLHCLGLTKEGHPRHPLYVARDTPLQPYTPVF